MSVSTLQPAKKVFQQRLGYKAYSKTSLREGFTAAEREELPYAISITDYIREKGITV